MYIDKCKFNDVKYMVVNNKLDRVEFIVESVMNMKHKLILYSNNIKWLMYNLSKLVNNTIIDIESIKPTINYLKFNKSDIYVNNLKHEIELFMFYDFYGTPLLSFINLSEIFSDDIEYVDINGDVLKCMSETITYTVHVDSLLNNELKNNVKIERYY